MNNIDSFVTSRSILIKRTKYGDSPVSKDLKTLHKRGYSQKYQSWYFRLREEGSKQTLIKINKNKLPKGFFNIPHLNELEYKYNEKFESRISNEETVDTPNPSSNTVGFEL
jgi:hypothetical protein